MRRQWSCVGGMVRRGQVSVNFRAFGTTPNDGVDIEDVSGTLIWEDGDAEPKTIFVPVLRESDGSRKTHTFEVILEEPSPQRAINFLSASLAHCLC